MTNLDKPLKMSSLKSNKLTYFFIAIALIGFLDALYLSVSHYTGSINCSVISGCQEVLVSQYSEIFGIPLALLGAIYYLFILFNSLLYIDNDNKWSKMILSYIPIIGFLFSIYLLYLMFFVINAVCQYCLLSATTSTLLFILSIIFIKNKNSGLNKKLIIKKNSESPTND